MILSCEKMIKDGEGKIGDAAKKDLENAITEAKGKLDSKF